MPRFTWMTPEQQQKSRCWISLKCTLLNSEQDVCLLRWNSTLYIPCISCEGFFFWKTAHICPLGATAGMFRHTIIKLLVEDALSAETATVLSILERSLWWVHWETFSGHHVQCHTVFCSISVKKVSSVSKNVTKKKKFYLWLFSRLI